MDAELHSAGMGVVPSDDPEAAACFFIYRVLEGARVLSRLVYAVYCGERGGSSNWLKTNSSRSCVGPAA